MKTVVICKSIYGTTKQYSKWIAEELGADLFEHSKVKIQDLEKYDTIIYGGGLYAGGICGVNLITKNFDSIKNKKIIVFTVGLADPQNQENINSITQSTYKIFTDEMKGKIKLFHFRGGIDYSKLSLIHKLMMAMMRKMILKKDTNELTLENKQFLETYGKVVDFTDISTITPLINFCNEQ
ncbi:MAG: flavodoxin domain-containing protein [Oscillospiraceae bacterium]